MTSSGCAVIVEPRQHRALKFVVETALPHLPPNWPIQLFHGTQNEDYVRRELAALIATGRVTLHNMNVSNLTRTMYSLMFLSVDFWQKCVGEHILIFQTDSTFLPTSPHKLHEFLQWDYIGAPWFDKKVGNGGFSLRKKSSSLVAVQAMTAQQQQSVRQGKMHEDGYFVNFFKHHPVYRLAPLHEAQKFSVEGMYYPRPLGIHQPWSYIDWIGRDNYRQLVMSNPMLQQLLRLNNQAVPTIQHSSRNNRMRKSHTPRLGRSRVKQISQSFLRRRAKSVGGKRHRRGM
jgi:hypothetical protein